MGVDNLGDLTSDTRPATATLWGVQIAPGDDLDQLVTIDPVTGGAIGSVPITINTTATNQPGHMTSIAFDPVSGALYGNTTVAFGAAFDALYKIDPVTGMADFIGRITFQDVFALGFSQTGKLFGIADATDELIGIDLVTGNGSFIANMQVSSSFDIASRPEDDVMFLVDSGSNFLYTLDTSNGNLTGVGDYGSPLNLVGLGVLADAGARHAAAGGARTAAAGAAPRAALGGDRLAGRPHGRSGTAPAPSACPCHSLRIFSRCCATCFVALRVSRIRCDFATTRSQSVAA